MMSSQLIEAVAVTMAAISGWMIPAVRGESGYPIAGPVGSLLPIHSGSSRHIDDLNRPSNRDWIEKERSRGSGP